VVPYDTDNNNYNNNNYNKYDDFNTKVPQSIGPYACCAPIPVLGL